MKIVAKRQGAEVYIIEVDGEQGFILDFDKKKRYPQKVIHSLSVGGYWSPHEDDQEKLKRMLSEQIESVCTETGMAKKPDDAHRRSRSDNVLLGARTSDGREIDLKTGKPVRKQATDLLLTYRAHTVAPGEFVEFWSDKYDDPLEPLYTKNIHQPPTPDRIHDLFVWKNGGKLSRAKHKSVERNYVKRISELSKLDNDTQATDFLNKFAKGGAIWRIFWMHCWQPKRFPIYDVHVHRSMCCIKRSPPDELTPKTDPEKIRLYIDEYMPFYRMFAGSDHRSTDQALWKFGKFIKRWKLDS